MGLRVSQYAHPDRLWDIWGADANNMWAVGGDPNTSSSVILKWDGVSWTKQSSGPFEGPLYSAIWGTDANNIWIVGGNGTILRW